jgi:hypothetical protein
VFCVNMRYLLLVLSLCVCVCVCGGNVTSLARSRSLYVCMRYRAAPVGHLSDGLYSLRRKLKAFRRMVPPVQR